MDVRTSRLLTHDSSYLLDMPDHTGTRADVGGLSRWQTDQLLKKEMPDENDDDESVISAVDEVDRKEMILKFIKENGHLLTSDMKDVHVPAMRHILPKLLMEVYSDHYAPYVRKVKGIWKNPPPGWPSDIEFVDPNNNMRASVGSTSRKPKKELLIPMLQHLVAKFQEIQGRLPVQVDAITDEELRNAMHMDWDQELKELTAKLRPKLIRLRKLNFIDESMFNKLLSVLGTWLSKSSYTEVEINNIHNLNRLLDLVNRRGHVTDDLRTQLNTIADSADVEIVSTVTMADIIHSSVVDRQPLLSGRDTLMELNINSRGRQSTLLMSSDDAVQQQDVVFNVNQPAFYGQTQQHNSSVFCWAGPDTVEMAEPNESVMVDKLNIRQRKNVEVQAGHLMKVELRPQCIPEQSGYEEVEKLEDFLCEDGDVMLAGKLPELGSDDIASLLRDAESYGDLLSDGVSEGGVMLHDSSVGDAVYENEGQSQMMEESLMFPAEIDTSNAALYSPSPHDTSLSVQPPAVVQGPMSPASSAGMLLHQLTINGTAVAISGSVGPPVQIRYMPTQVASPHMNNQGLSHGKRMAAVIPSVVEEQESDDDDQPHNAPTTVKRQKKWN